MRGASLLLLALSAVVLGADFGIVGLKDPLSWKLLRILSSSKKHRIACFDEREDLTRSVISQGGISAFGLSNVLKFSPIVVVFQDDLLSFVDRLEKTECEGKEFVFFNRAVDEGALAREVLLFFPFFFFVLFFLALLQKNRLLRKRARRW